MGHRELKLYLPLQMSFRRNKRVSEIHITVLVNPRMLSRLKDKREFPVGGFGKIHYHALPAVRRGIGNKNPKVILYRPGWTPDKCVANFQFLTRRLPATRLSRC